MLNSKLVKIPAVYLSTIRSINVFDVSSCLGGDLPVLIMGDLNPEHAVWNCRVITIRVRQLRD